jgi:hypothetical protein
VSAEELGAAGPAPRQAAAVVALSDTELLLFGGGGCVLAWAVIRLCSYSQPKPGRGQSEATQFGDVWVLSAAPTPTWRRVEATGEAPCARTGHAMAVLGSSVVVVGGTSAERGFLAEAHALDTHTWSWSVAAGEGALADSRFTPRDKLTAVTCGHRVVVFGGFGPTQQGQERQEPQGGAGEDAAEEEEEDEDEGDDDEEDGTTFTWFNDAFVVERIGNEWQWRPQPTTGDAPSPRAAHGAAALGGSMYVFGGRDASGRVNDTYSLDCVDWAWTKHEAPQAAAPLARSFHALVALPPPMPCAVTFGGLSADGSPLDVLEVLDARQQPACWRSVKHQAGAWPRARSSAAAAMLGDRLVVLGGAGADDHPCADALLHLAPLIEALQSEKQP